MLAGFQREALGNLIVKRDGPRRFLGKFPSAPGDDVRVALKEASLEGRWVLWYGESQAVLAREAEGHLRGLQPLPAWQAEKQLRGVQGLPAWEGEIPTARTATLALTAR